MCSTINLLRNTLQNCFNLNRKLIIIQKNSKLLKTLPPLNMDYHHSSSCPSCCFPPKITRGMTELDRELFQRSCEIPSLNITNFNAHLVLPHLKQILFKMDHLKPVQTTTITATENTVDGGDNDNIITQKTVLLDPSKVKSFNDVPQEIRAQGLTEQHFKYQTILIKYENWKIEHILKSILPENQEGLTSYSRVGHVTHVNLRQHLLPYKQLIGQVLLDKIPNCRTIVNKSQTIDNTYRNFEFELLGGKPEYQVEVKENGIIFEFDFSKVYWNPRLATEHERIVKLIKPNDLLYDVFAGVGPFSVPVGKRNGRVFANDLNPNSYKWLNHNVRKNKVTSMVTTFNKDGRDFILTDIKNDLIKQWTNNLSSDTSANYQIHITMNLPAMAVEFLDSFRDLIPISVYKLRNQLNMPLVHCYCFVKTVESSIKPELLAKQLVEKYLGVELDDRTLQGIYFVRNVAPNKDMFRVSFYLTEEILCYPIETVSLQCVKRTFDSTNDSKLLVDDDKPASKKKSM